MTTSGEFRYVWQERRGQWLAFIGYYNFDSRLPFYGWGMPQSFDDYDGLSNRMRKATELLNSGMYSGLDDAELCKEILG